MARLDEKIRNCSERSSARRDDRSCAGRLLAGTALDVGPPAGERSSIWSSTPGDAQRAASPRPTRDAPRARGETIRGCSGISNMPVCRSRVLGSVRSVSHSKRAACNRFARHRRRNHVLKRRTAELIAFDLEFERHSAERRLEAMLVASSVIDELRRRYRSAIDAVRSSTSQWNQLGA